MLARLMLLFVVVPLVELYLLITLANYTNLTFTFGLIFVTGIVGAALARWQGLRTVSRIQTEMAEGRPPAEAMMHGLCILIAGAFLLTPGILTDVVGFSLLIPPVRAWLARRIIRRWMSNYTQQGNQFHWTFTTGDPPPPARDEIIETRVIEAGEGDEDRSEKGGRPRHDSPVG